MAAAENENFPELPEETRSEKEYSKLIELKKSEFMSLGSKCDECWQKKQCCICQPLRNLGASSESFSTFEFIVYMSREEYLCAGNSGHLLSVMFPRQTSVFIYGTRVESDKLRKCLMNKQKNGERICVLFPGADALTVPQWINSNQCNIHHDRSDMSSGEILTRVCDSYHPHPENAKTTVILVDGTWRQARHMAKYLKKALSPNIPHVTLTITGDALISSFHRKQSQEGRICTIEALALFVSEVFKTEQSELLLPSSAQQSGLEFEQTVKRALALCRSALAPVKEPLNWVGNGRSPAWYFGESLVDGAVVN